MATIARAPFWIVDPVVIDAMVQLGPDGDAVTDLAVMLFTARHTVEDMPAGGELEEIRIVRGGLVIRLRGDQAVRCLLADDGERWRC